MNQAQIELNRFADFLKLLARGCHVRIERHVYAMSGEDIIYIPDFKYDPHKAFVGYARARTTIWWLEQLRNAGMEVLYSPKAEVSTRNVRAIEL